MRSCSQQLGNMWLIILASVCVLPEIFAGNSDQVIKNVGPWGFLGYCPGSTKPVKISEKSLKYLTLMVHGPGLPFISNRTEYGFYQMKKVAQDPHIDFKRKTFLFIGGYNDHPNLPISRLLGTLYTRLNYNVLVLNLNRFSTYMYPLAVRNMRAVGVRAAEMLINLMREGLNPATLEILGLSLGGQTISFIAKNFYKQSGIKIGRITALDPSGPCFRHLGPEHRIDSSDADFVDIIITNADALGTGRATGHVNIFVNGGEYQPGDFFFLACEATCSHIRSYTIWLASLIYTKGFIAIKCDSDQQARNHDCYDRRPVETNVLGVGTNRSNHGIFYLATDNNFPYYLGKKGVRKEHMFWNSHLEEYNLDDLVEL